MAQTICIAGAGDLGQYLLEELSSDERYNVAVLTRQKDKAIPNLKATFHPTDYSEESVLSILDATGATALISTIRCPDEKYISLHQGFLNACLRSTTCKRFIPSEWAGNVELYPGIPRAYGNTRAPFRKILEQTPEIQWTSFNHGWFMDYFVKQNQTYMTHHAGEFPINHNSWEYCVRGTGDEPQSWTCGRDVGRAVAELLAAPEWEQVTYIAGEWGTYNEAVKLMESFHGRQYSRTYRPESEIRESLEKYKNDSESWELAIAEGEEWQISGATCCPEEKTLRQRHKYFSSLHFLSIQELLKKAEATGHV
ncbi:hypothetical protein BGW36DRAFT_383759 [Talaromyces proteolyticus]|uniref:NmrA-like domain-containing protein n=1 Tax=Talaromyces proteolyticus TaxID=1131652 RepID=A0AAD4KLD8_9EURO|nr:uncharacterized protein BGW36DRAFT_383759 [Talaromyces proteolyticus]KAH8693801.1 hypothetical protein BGW36DRAFT_383759 [Talaromyces proteolyticus]